MPAVIAGDFNRSAAALAPFFRAEDGFRVHTRSLTSSTVASASGGAIDHLITRNLTSSFAATWCPSMAASCPAEGLGSAYVSDHLALAIDIERQWSTLLPLESTLDEANALFAHAGLARRSVNPFDRTIARRARARPTVLGSLVGSRLVATSAAPWHLAARSISMGGVPSLELQ